ncbi:MAG TPA: alpha/beta fold hydrolase [Actinocrinis sp.]|jgi:surfactin synthase thioesterase subunit
MAADPTTAELATAEPTTAVPAAVASTVWSPARRADWIRAFHPSPEAPVRLVCLPHAGGSAGFFFPLSRMLAPAVEVLAVQYPGRQDRRAEPVVRDLHVLADLVCEALADVPGLGRPVLFGHSMGASLAFEVARRMEAAGGPAPRLLIASARRAPSVPTPSAVHRMDDAGIVAELKRLSGTAGALFADPEMLRAALPAVRGDYAAIETYTCVPQAAVRCPVEVFHAGADPLTDRAHALAWRGHTTAGFALREFRGGHFYLETWPQDVVAAVRAAVAAAAGPAASGAAGASAASGATRDIRP